MYTTTTTILNAEQLKALKEWAMVHGRTWKADLRHAWETGDYDGIEPYGNTAAYLQQVRNHFGPSWLVRFVLPKSGGYTIFNDTATATEAEKSELVL